MTEEQEKQIDELIEAGEKAVQGRWATESYCNTARTQVAQQALKDWKDD